MGIAETRLRTVPFVAFVALSWSIAAAGDAAAAITFHSFSEAKRSGEVDSVTLSLPSGSASGDLLIAAVSTEKENSGSLSPPGGAGWTEIELGANEISLGVWWKIAGASEPASHTFTWSDKGQAYAWMMRFSGHDASSPIEASALRTGTGARPRAPSVTTSVANTMILRLGSFKDDNVTIDDTGLSGHTDITMDTSGSGEPKVSGGAGYMALPAAGSSGTARFRLTRGRDYVTATVAIAPSSAPVVISNPVADWRFDESSWNGSADEVRDSSGNDYHGTAANLSPVSGMLCNAANLGANSTSDFLSMDSAALDGATDFTISVWGRTTQSSDGTILSAARGDSSRDANEAVFYFGAGDRFWPTITDTPFDTATRFSASPAVNGGSWVHMAWTRNAATRQSCFYVDAVSQGCITHPDSDDGDPLVVVSGGLFLGQDQDSFGGSFDINQDWEGLIDELLIFPQVLSATQLGTIRSNQLAGNNWDGSARNCSNFDHFAIVHSGSGINCQAENVTITAHDASHAALTSHAGAVTLSTTTSHGDWSLSSGSGTLVNSGGGSGSYSFDAADNGQVVLGLRDSFVESTNIDVADGMIIEDGSEDADLSFAESGFVFLANGVKGAIGTQIGGKSSSTAPGAQTLELQAVRTSDDTGACESFLTGSNTLRLAFECENPTTCTSSLLDLNGVDIASNASGASLSYTNVTLDFGDSSDTTATLAIAYPDVGQIQLHAALTLSPSGVLMLGASNSFVVRPFAFDVSASGNPAATDSSGSVFTTAGSNFAATARALLWSAADDSNGDGIADNHTDADPTNNANLSDNSPALNYGREITTQSILLAAALYAPSGGNDPGLSGATTLSSFSSGSASSSSVFYGEVGVIELSASVGTGSYLGIGASETAKIVGRSGPVGRFTPDHFDASPNAAQLSTAAGSGGFTYVGQSFDYVAGSEPAATVTARNAQGTTTQNYTGGWFKITSASLTNRSYASASGTLAVSAPNAPNVSDAGGGIGIVTFDTGPELSMQRSGPITPFDAEIALRFDLLDSDGISWTGANPFSFGQPSSGLGIAFDNGKEMRFGRIAIASAHGSELLALPVPLRAEYWNGSGFVPNSADEFTVLSTGDLGVALNPGGLATSPSIGNTPLLLGDAGLSFSSPGAANTGTADLVYDLVSAGLSHLLFDWDGDSSHDDNPTGRATFGVFAGDDPVIFVRELY